MLDTRRQRGFPEITREYFEHEVEYGSLYVGSPDTVARRIARTMTTVGASRFDLKYGMGPMVHATLMENTASSAPRSPRECASNSSHTTRPAARHLEPPKG